MRLVVATDDLWDEFDDTRSPPAVAAYAILTNLVAIVAAVIWWLR